MRSDLQSCRVLVTPTTFGKHDPELRRTLEEAVGAVIYNDFGRPLHSHEVAELVRGCDGYIAGLDTIDRSALAQSDRLRVIARYGVGVDRVDIQAAAERGIAVTNTPDANSTSVAELTIGFMLALARDFVGLDSLVRRNEWPRANGVTIAGKTVGLVGLGDIGKQVAVRLQSWDAQVVCYDPAVNAASAEKVGARKVSLDELLKLADFVSLHVPVLETTRQMVNADFLSKMKPGAQLVNTARGELVDETALAAALASGRLHAAALDAFASEPPERDNPLLKLRNVILTPHCGAHTDSATANMGWSALRDCLSVLRGEAPKYPVLSNGARAYA